MKNSREDWKFDEQMVCKADLLIYNEQLRINKISVFKILQQLLKREKKEGKREGEGDQKEKHAISFFN